MILNPHQLLGIPQVKAHMFQIFVDVLITKVLSRKLLLFRLQSTILFWNIILLGRLNWLYLVKYESLILLLFSRSIMIQLLEIHFLFKLQFIEIPKVLFVNQDMAIVTPAKENVGTTAFLGNRKDHSSSQKSKSHPHRKQQVCFHSKDLINFV
jgi:hypothetical protein